VIENEVEHSIRDRIRDLIGVTHRDAFGGEEVAAVAHEILNTKSVKRDDRN
jgi:peptide subunit release factor 1 (eRF1)